MYYNTVIECPKIQQTKMLVTCQRSGDLIFLGLVWQYSTNQNQYNKGRFKVMLLTCSSNITLSLFLLCRESKIFARSSKQSQCMKVGSKLCYCCETLNLPLLYFVWTEENCQTSPNKNKSLNLWHITSILVCCTFDSARDVNRWFWD